MTRPKRYPEYIRRRIISLHRTGLGSSAIIQKIGTEDSFALHRSGINRLIRKWSECGHISDTEKRRPPNYAMFLPGELKMLSEQLHQPCSTQPGDISAEASASKIISGIRQWRQNRGEPDLNVSCSTVQRVRRSLGFVRTKAKYCQVVRKANMPKRVNFSLKIMRDPSLLKHVIFSDESAVQLDSHARFFYRPIGKPLRALRQRPKHPAKIHMWAGISWLSATPIVIMSGETRIDSIKYCEVLEEGLIPFLEQKREKFLLQADSAPCHKSAKTMEFITARGINYEREWWPPESPDINPIELVWHELKEYLCTEYKPRNLQSLKEGVSKFWRERMTVQKCQKYISHVLKVLPAVIRSNGGPTMH